MVQMLEEHVKLPLVDENEFFGKIAFSLLRVGAKEEDTPIRAWSGIG